MSHLDAVLDAARERELSALTEVLDALSAQHGLDEAQRLLRSEVLPQLSLKDLLWLWRSITSPMEQHKILSKMADGTAKRLLGNGFQIGKDFSFAEGSDGNRRLMLSAEAKSYLELTLKTESLVTLALLTRHKHVV
jgi:hypothetical protein